MSRGHLPAAGRAAAPAALQLALRMQPLVLLVFFFLCYW